MQRSKNRYKAITLIEILTVIAIFLIIATISAGFIKHYQPNIQLTVQAKNIRTNINKAREKTISEQKIYAIKIFPEQDKYDFILASDPDSAIESYQLSSEIEFSELGLFTDDIISFNKAGAAKEAGIIIIKNSRSEQKTITINPSGYIYEE